MAYLALHFQKRKPIEAINIGGEKLFLITNNRGKLVMMIFSQPMRNSLEERKHNNNFVNQRGMHFSVLAICNMSAARRPLLSGIIINVMAFGGGRREEVGTEA